MTIVYTRNACGACIGTKKFLEAHGVPFEEINVQAEGNEDLAQQLVDEGWRAMPVVKASNGHEWAGMNKTELSVLVLSS